MARDMITADRAAWERLAEAVSRRRELLGTQPAAVARANRSVQRISQSVWSIIENASQKTDTMARSSLVGIDIGCDWPSGHALGILRGEVDPIIELDERGAATPADIIPLLDEALSVMQTIRDRVAAQVPDSPPR